MIYLEKTQFNEYEHFAKNVCAQIMDNHEDFSKRKWKRSENKIVSNEKKKVSSWYIPCYYGRIEPRTWQKKKLLCNKDYSSLFSQFKFLVNLNVYNKPDIDSLNNSINFL